MNHFKHLSILAIANYSFFTKLFLIPRCVYVFQIGLQEKETTIRPQTIITYNKDDDKYQGQPSTDEQLHLLSGQSYPSAVNKGDGVYIQLQSLKQVY